MVPFLGSSQIYELHSLSVLQLVVNCRVSLARLLWVITITRSQGLCFLHVTAYSSNWLPWRGIPQWSHFSCLWSYCGWGFSVHTLTGRGCLLLISVVCEHIAWFVMHSCDSQVAEGGRHACWIHSYSTLTILEHSKNRGKREPGNIHGKSCQLPVCHHSCDQRRTLSL